MTTIREQAEKGIIPMPQTDAEWAAAREAKRATNVANAIEVLDKAGIESVAYMGVYPIRFEVKHSNGWIVYFPEFGRWIDNNGRVRFGVRNLVKYLKGELI